MTIKDLRDFLSNYPEDMEIVEKRCSDLNHMDISDWSVIEARQKFGDDWLFDVNDWRLKDPVKYGLDLLHPVKKYIHFRGN